MGVNPVVCLRGTVNTQLRKPVTLGPNSRREAAFQNPTVFHFSWNIQYVEEMTQQVAYLNIAKNGHSLIF